MVERLDPHPFIEEPTILNCKALVHPLHGKANAVGGLPKASSMLTTLPRVSVIRLKLTYFLQ